MACEASFQQILCLRASPLSARDFHHNAPLAAMLIGEAHGPNNIAMANVARPSDELIEATGAFQAWHEGPRRESRI